MALSGGFLFAGGFALVDSSHIIAHLPLADLLCAVIGIATFFVTLHVARALGWLHGRIAEHLLVRL